MNLPSAHKPSPAILVPAALLASVEGHLKDAMKYLEPGKLQDFHGGLHILAPLQMLPRALVMS